MVLPSQLIAVFPIIQDNLWHNKKKYKKSSVPAMQRVLIDYDEIESLFERVWILSSMEFAKLALSLRKFELFYYYYYYVYIFHINHYSESKHYIPTTLYFQIHKVFLVFINKYTFLYLSVTNDGFFLSHVCLLKQEIFIPTL